jgi:magnesium chelatase family protein
LAHLGVLFLDEIAEFSRTTLEALRQPIETGEVNISRVRATVAYPCRFTLVAAMNPCPCGYYGSEQCHCSRNEVTKYQRKLSGPIIDRIDLQVEMDRLSVDERFAPTESDVSPRLRAAVELARERQRARYEGMGIPFNAAIPGGQMQECVIFSDDGLRAYKSLVEKNTLTTRSVDRLAKVARTIADLAGAGPVEPVHVKEAATFVIGGILRESF